MWGMALLVAGELIDSERWAGTLEALIATPASFALVITGRIAAVTLVSLVAFAETWVVAWAVFGIAVAVPHPALLLLTVVVTAVAMAGTASMMSAVCARPLRTNLPEFAELPVLCARRRTGAGRVAARVVATADPRRVPVLVG